MVHGQFGEEADGPFTGRSGKRTGDLLQGDFRYGRQLLSRFVGGTRQGYR
jgi:hypothetical protein